MNFNTFWTNLQALQKSIAITTPVPMHVKRSYWGSPLQSNRIETPCIINALAEPERSVGFGGLRNQRVRIVTQCLVAPATVEDDRVSLMATAFWYAAKDKFDSDRKIGGSVALSLLRGADPTVPVILQHAGQAYIGFNAVLELHDVEQFQF